MDRGSEILSDPLDRRHEIAVGRFDILPAVTDDDEGAAPAHQLIDGQVFEMPAIAQLENSVGLPVAGIKHRIEAARSEEQTSELQSLIRISYAVFCLKKKTIY